MNDTRTMNDTSTEAVAESYFQCVEVRGLGDVALVYWPTRRPFVDRWPASTALKV